MIRMRTRSMIVGLRQMIQHIRKHLGSTKQLTIVEIGSYNGDSTAIFARNFEQVYAVDPWKANKKEGDACSKENIAAAETNFDKMADVHDNVIKVKTTSKQAARRFRSKTIDVLYIDGRHTENGVTEDIELFTKKVKPGGFICGHDFWNKKPGVMRAVRKAFGEPDKTFKDSSWLVRVEEGGRIKG